MQKCIAMHKNMHLGKNIEKKFANQTKKWRITESLQE